MKKIYTIAFIIATSIFSANAQMLADFAQFNTNLTFYNPAYAGLSESNLNATLLTRYDWFGISGSPFSNAVSLDKRFDSKNIGLNANINQLNYGNYHLLDIFGSAAYHLDLGGEKKLSFGIKGGLTSASVSVPSLENTSDLTYNETQTVTTIIPKLGLGFAFKSENFHLGVSLPDAIGYDSDKNVLKTDTIGKRSFFDQKNIVFNGYYKLALNDDYHLIPSLLVRISPTNLPKTDISINVGKTESYWAGLVISPNNSIKNEAATYKLLNNAGLTGGMYINGRLKLGGAFLYNFNINNVYKTSGEVSLTYDLEDVF